MRIVTSAPDAFLSYTRFDDQHDGGAISEFRLRLESAVRAVTGERFEIFQDIDGIGLGEKWSDKLDQILDQARFFMPILTPSYFASPACRDELEKFLGAEAAQARSDLVLPIYYIECEMLENPDLCRADPLASAIHERQRQDWRELRFEPIDAKDVRLAREHLARQISHARRRAIPLTPSGGSDKRQRATPRRKVGSVPVPIETPPAVLGDSQDQLRPGTVFRDIDAPWCPELVVIPRGEFLMGSPTDEEGRSDDEGPQHEAIIACDLAVGRYPITFAEYEHFAETSRAVVPSDEGWGRGRRPVINATWRYAKAYVTWLGKETGEAYRLLSEAEWEYACRAGTTSRYSWGDYPRKANEKANFDMSQGRTTEVGAYPPNEWGLHDMHGNVWEWVEDCWNENYEGAPNDGSAWIIGDCNRRVLRGGSWRNLPSNLRSAYRSRGLADLRKDCYGFRVARTLP